MEDPRVMAIVMSLMGWETVEVPVDTEFPKSKKKPK